MVALMTMSFCYAETESFKSESNVENFITNFMNFQDKRFDMSCDMRRLASVLDLTEWQMEAVEAIQNSFNDEMQSLASVRGPQRRHLVHQAVRKDAHQMQHVLNDKQFETYMTLLVTTLQNKHL